MFKPPCPVKKGATTSHHSILSSSLGCDSIRASACAGMRLSTTPSVGAPDHLRRHPLQRNPPAQRAIFGATTSCPSRWSLDCYLPENVREGRLDQEEPMAAVSDREIPTRRSFGTPLSWARRRREHGRNTGTGSFSITE